MDFFDEPLKAIGVILGTPTVAIAMAFFAIKVLKTVFKIIVFVSVVALALAYYFLS